MGLSVGVRMLLSLLPSLAVVGCMMLPARPRGIQGRDAFHSVVLCLLHRILWARIMMASLLPTCALTASWMVTCPASSRYMEGDDSKYLMMVAVVEGSLGFSKGSASCTILQQLYLPDKHKECCGSCGHLGYSWLSAFWDP